MQIKTMKNFDQEGILINLYLLQCLHLSMGSNLQGRVRVGQQDGQFFYQVQLAVHCTAAVLFGFANNGPFNDQNVTQIFKARNKQ